MAKLPLYEQQTSVGAVRADAQDFGAGVAQATGQMGGVLRDIGETMMRREENIKGIVEFNTINDQLRQDLEAVRSSGNIALGETVDKYKQVANQRVEEALSRVSGRSSFKASLRAQFTNQAAQYVQQARSEQVKAQYQLATDYVGKLAGQMAQDAAFSPEKLDDYLTLYNMGVDKFEGSFDKNTVDKIRQAGASDLVQATVSSLHESGNWQSARKILDRPDIKPLMAGENGIRLSLQNLKMERVAMKEDADRQRNTAMWSNLLGRQISPQEAATLPDFTKITSPTDKAAALRLVRGTGPTQQEFEQLLGVGDRSASSKTNRLSELTVKVLSGQATPQDAVEFKVLSNTTFGEVLRQNAQGYQEWTGNVNTPPEIRQAMAMISGAPMGGAPAPVQPAIGGAPITDASGGIAPGSLVELTDASGQVIGRGRADARGMFSIDAQPGGPGYQSQGGATGSWGDTPTAPAQGQPQQSRRQGPMTVFQALNVTAGPVNKALGVTRRVFGSAGPEAGIATVQNQPVVEGFINRMVQFYGGDDRLLAAERKDLITEIGKINSTFTSERGAQETAYGIDVAMERIMMRAEKAANDKTLAAKDSNDARKLYGEMKALRDEFGVVRPKSQAELKQAYLEGKLDIGMPFFLPDGTVQTFDQQAYDMLFGGRK